MDNSEHLFPARAVILVADDDPAVLELLRVVLEQEGYSVLTAADGDEAMRISRAFSGTIHLVVTDLHMPGLDGLQLREKLQVERPATRVLLMSGQIFLADEWAFLLKPFNLDLLKTRVRQLFFTYREFSAGSGQ
jgi:DNA-binding response OmpR family regulator